MNADDTYMQFSGLRRGLMAGLWLAGVIAVVIGVTTLVLPLSLDLEPQLLLGTMLSTLGGGQVVFGMFIRRTRLRIWVLALGALYLVVGAILLLFEMEGVLTLTATVAVLLVLSGVAKLIVSWEMRPTLFSARNGHSMTGWRLMSLSGATSVILGSILFLGLPGTATFVLEFLLGLDVTALGIAQIAMALSLRPDVPK